MFFICFKIKIGDKFNIFLKSYHVLEPSALKFIYLANDLKRKEGALTVGRELALSSHGTLNLFHVCEKENEQEDKEQEQEAPKKETKSENK